jgi:hypothetical protein
MGADQGIAKGWMREKDLASWIESPSSVLGQPHTSHLKQCSAGASPAAGGMRRVCFKVPWQTAQGPVVGNSTVSFFLGITPLPQFRPHKSFKSGFGRG